MFVPLDFGALHNVACTIYVLAEYLLFGSFDAKSNIMFIAVLMLRLFVGGPIISH